MTNFSYYLYPFMTLILSRDFDTALRGFQSNLAKGILISFKKSV